MIKLRSSRGFTLGEVMVATFIACVFLTGILLLHMQQRQQVIIAKRISAAFSAAEAIMEDLTSRPYNDALLDQGRYYRSVPLDYGPEGSEAENTTFTIEIRDIGADKKHIKIIISRVAGGYGSVIGGYGNDTLEAIYYNY